MQPESAGWEGILPLHLERPFQLWSYQASHRQLLLRGRPGDGLEGTVEIEFLDVLGMKVKSQYRELLISPAPDTAAEVDEFTELPERHGSRYTRLLVSDGTTDGFVVCGSLRIHGT
ncbi:hypothetical protein ACGGAI_09750 [Streptomyces antibioticus]|uniref:hypothetical protein n=1 Tax=Streptomyces antibioticus TaxID=1890 RepID=UPI003724A9CA